LSFEYKIWKKDHNKKKWEFSKLINAYDLENKKHKLHFYYNDKSDVFSITTVKKLKNKDRYLLSKDEKVKIAKQYEKEIQKFVDFIYSYYSK
jgi:hypothetical protein